MTNEEIRQFLEDYENGKADFTKLPPEFKEGMRKDQIILNLVEYLED